ncbi:MAG: methionine adenosyltransferase domain-containing protein [Comamonadaceae bacterium]|nr:methionine adenosyltransferase domain-containing protein [Comamonadaceae bacterium]
MGDCRAHRPQDHRRHLRRHGPPRRRRLLAARTRRRWTAPRRYCARYVAKNIVAAGLRRRAAEVQVAYAIGVAQPVGVHGRHLRHRQGRATRRSPSSCWRHFDLRPGRIIRDLDLLRPIYQHDRGLRPLRPQ